MAMKVVVADDHQIFRQGLVLLLEQQVAMEVVGQAADGRSAVALCESLQPDVILMDVEMRDLNGVEATRQIRATCPKVKVIALSAHSSQRCVSQMLEAGALGYVLKDCALDELTEALATVKEGKEYLSARVMKTLVQDYVERVSGRVRDPKPKLSPREREIVQLFAEGKQMKEMAALLNVSVRTIASHRKHIMHKLELPSFADLVKWAVREGVASLDS